MMRVLQRAIFPWQTEAGAPNLLDCIVHNRRWTRRAHGVELEYMMGRVRRLYPQAVGNLRIDTKTKEIYVVSDQALQRDQAAGPEIWEKRHLDTKRFPVILSPQRRRQINTQLAQTLAPILLTNFLETIGFPQQATPKMIQNAHLLLTILTKKGIIVLDPHATSTLSNWRIDRNTFAISKAGDDVPNTTLLHYYVQQTFSSKLMGDGMIPALTAFEERFAGNLHKDEHFVFVCSHI